MKLVLVLLSVLWLAGCKKSNKIPGDVLAPQKMQAVMWDIMRADQFLSDYVLNRDSTKDKDRESIKLYNRVFAFHHITKEEFEKSFAYYRKNPVRLQTMMDSISKQKSAILSPDSTGTDTIKKVALETVDTPVSKDTIRKDTIRKDTIRRGILKKDTIYRRGRKKLIMPVN